MCPSRNSNAQFPEAIKLINSGRIPMDGVITKLISLGEVEDVIKGMIRSPSDYLKVVVKI